MSKRVCYLCQKEIEANRSWLTSSKGAVLHPECFKCSRCNQPIVTSQFVTKGELSFCNSCEPMPIRTNYCHKCGADVGSSYSTMNGQPICENCKIQVIESQQTSQQPKSVDTPIRSKVIVSKFVHQSKENKRKSNDDGNPLQFESVQVRERIEIPRWNDRLDRIERVYKMHQEGLMTKDDFVAAKRQALYGNY